MNLRNLNIKGVSYTYHIATDEKGIFELALNVRGLPSTLMKVAFNEVKKNKKIKGSIDSIEGFKVPESYFSAISAGVAKDFAKLKRMLQAKHEIEFKRHNVVDCFYQKNKLNNEEWICIIIYRGDYICSE